MNLLDLRIPLRRRRLDEIFDLAVIVLKSNHWRYGRILFPFTLSCIAINYGVTKLVKEDVLANGMIVLLLLFESSVLQMIFNALNGRIVFELKPRFRDVLADTKQTAPVYIGRMAILNTLYYTLLFPFIIPPVRALFTHFFMGEVIILERLRGAPLGLRAAALARGQGDRIVGFFVFSCLMFLAGLVSTVYGLSSMRELMGGWAEKNIPSPGFAPTGVIFQLVFFPSIAYFCLVRFLLYLDTRIAGEGWDIELLLARGIQETRQEPEARYERRSA